MVDPPVQPVICTKSTLLREGFVFQLYYFFSAFFWQIKKLENIKGKCSLIVLFVFPY